MFCLIAFAETGNVPYQPHIWWETGNVPYQPHIWCASDDSDWAFPI